ncbi:MAG: hypothetical protein EXS55_01645 [Candidatus Magasanikbacteria bacterium]|nr:hypothetical protein [Candidatus Magasanikbacteria bacterium]
MGAENKADEWVGVTAEPDYAIEKVKAGEFVVAYFGGQTVLYIPKEVFLKLGGQASVVREIADQVYGAEVMENFFPSTYTFAYSFFTDLPPQDGWSEQQFRPLGKVAEMIKVIKERVSGA